MEGWALRRGCGLHGPFVVARQTTLRRSSWQLIGGPLCLQHCTCTARLHPLKATGAVSSYRATPSPWQAGGSRRGTVSLHTLAHTSAGFRPAARGAIAHKPAALSKWSKFQIVIWNYNCNLAILGISFQNWKLFWLNRCVKLLFLNGQLQLFIFGILVRNCFYNNCILELQL